MQEDRDSGKGMIPPDFLTSSERRELQDSVRSNREVHGVARRANAILLLDNGKSCQVIAEFLCLDDDTIRGSALFACRHKAEPSWGSRGQHRRRK